MTATITAVALGAAIARRRQDRGMSAAVLADLSAVGRSTLDAIEAGQFRPSGHQLATIATALLSTPDALRRSANHLAVTP